MENYGIDEDVRDLTLALKLNFRDRDLRERRQHHHLPDMDVENGAVVRGEILCTKDAFLLLFGMRLPIT